VFDEMVRGLEDSSLFCYIGNCSYSSGTPTRIALAILGVQSAGFALFCEIGKRLFVYWRKFNGI